MESLSPDPNSKYGNNREIQSSIFSTGAFKDQVLYFTFNQDSSCLAVGTKKGFRIYQCNPFDLINSADVGPIGIVEMQFTSNILALVGQSKDQGMLSQKKLTMWDTKVGQPTVEISFQWKIVGVKMNSQHIYAATKDRIFVYSLQGMKLVAKIECDNHLGRIVLSPNSTIKPYLLYSQSCNEGLLTVFDTHAREKINVIRCHRTPILKIAVNMQGSLVATCSTTGSMIRVFSLPKGDKLYSFTRGLKNTIQYYLNFSRDTQYLISTSDTGTIHIFQLEELTPGAADRSKSIIDESRVVIKQPKQSSWINFFLPKFCDDYMHADKSIMNINCPLLAQRQNIIGVDFQNTNLFSFTQDGDFYTFEMNIELKTLKQTSKKHMDDNLEFYS